MNNILIKIFFSIMTFIAFLYCYSYGRYEFNAKSNKVGGTVFIVFSLVCTIYSNVIFYLN